MTQIRIVSISGPMVTALRTEHARLDAKQRNPPHRSVCSQANTYLQYPSAYMFITCARLNTIAQKALRDNCRVCATASYGPLTLARSRCSWHQSQ